MISDVIAGSDDEIWMRVALSLGRQAQGRTSENPAVGCVILDGDGVLVGQGATSAKGRPHAETNALLMAGDAARGGTAYVTLEPCYHHGKTPPCADALISAGVKRCVVAITDPDPRVSGAGIAKLKNSGVAIQTDILGAQAKTDLSGFLLRTQNTRPHISMKIATSADGYIAAHAGTRTAITGRMAQRWVHDMRSRYDAILTGAGTVRTDDPLLTCRAPLKTEDSPIRIILDTSLSLSMDNQIIQTAKQVPVWLVVSESVPDSKKRPFMAAGVKFIEEKQMNGTIDLPSLFTKLGKAGLNNVMVEAGAKLNRSFITNKLADDIFVLTAPIMLGEGGLGAVAGVDRLESALTRYYIKGIMRDLDADKLVCWQPK